MGNKVHVVSTSMEIAEAVCSLGKTYHRYVPGIVNSRINGADLLALDCNACWDAILDKVGVKKLKHRRVLYEELLAWQDAHCYYGYSKLCGSASGGGEVTPMKG